MKGSERQEKERLKITTNRARTTDECVDVRKKKRKKRCTSVKRKKRNKNPSPPCHFL